jgi:hypothetical protein
MLFRPKNIVYILLFTFSFSQISYSQENEFRVGRLSEGIRVYVDQNLKMGFMDQYYNKLTGPIFDYPSSMVYNIPFFSEGLCVFYVKQASEEGERYKYGFINKNFQVVISAKFPLYNYYCDNTPPYFSAERAIVNSPYKNDYEHDNIFILIDNKGKQLGKEFDYLMPVTAACSHFPEITENLIAYEGEKGYGYLDARSGLSSITPSFSNAGPFSEGLALVEIAGKYLTIIDRSGKPVISQKFYIVKNGSKSPSLYSNYYGDARLNGFIHGELFIQYFDQGGAGEHVYALIDKTGKIIKKKSEKSVFNQIDFEQYRWSSKIKFD